MSIKKPVLRTAGALAGSLLLAGSAFAITPLAQGYMLGAAQDTAGKTSEAGCGANHAKHAEGSCGMDKMDTDKDGKISQAEFGVAHGGDTSKFAAHDGNADGFVEEAEMKAHHAAKKPAAAKASMEGKCGEGKCGASK